MIKKNDDRYNKLTRSMRRLSSGMSGEKDTHYRYTLGANINDLNCNISFSPQDSILLSRIIIAPKDHITHLIEDVTFSTNLNAIEFSDLDFSFKNEQQEQSLEKILLSLTMCISKDLNWKYTTSYGKLINILDNNSLRSVSKAIQSIYNKSHDMNKVIDLVVSSIGMKRAKYIIPKAYVLTPLANLWYQSLKTLKRELDNQNLTHYKFKDMNFYGNHAKTIENHLRKIDKND